MIPLGKPLTFYGLAVGLALKQIDSTHYLCSFHDGSDNRKEVVHVDDIVLGGRLHVASTKNEVIEALQTIVDVRRSRSLTCNFLTCCTSRLFAEQK